MPFGLFFFLLLSTFGAAAENACPLTELIKLAELYANPHLHPCQRVSAGFLEAPPKGNLTNPQIKAICGSDACRALVKDVLSLKPADCFLSLGGVKLNAYKIASSVQNACDAENSQEDNTSALNSKTSNSSMVKVNDKDKKSTSKPTRFFEKNSTLSDKDNVQLDEPMVIDNNLDNQHCPTLKVEKETAKEAGSSKPPINNTAFEMFPPPDTTYKATEPHKI
ncbi:putative elicitin [Plasmopara halstedii]